MAVLIEASDLQKRFGEIVAVDGISLRVQQGEVLGFLGPNGAGKSTTMKMLTGFLEPDAGSARIAGIDVLEFPKLAKAQARLPAGRRALLRRHDRARLPHLHRGDPRLRPRRGQATRRRRGREDAAGLGAGAEDRDAVEGLQAPRRHRPGHPARPASADHGRAHRRPRPQPEAPGAQADRRHGRGQGHHRLHPHPGGGGGGVLARRHHQSRPDRRRRHGRGPDAPPALSQHHRPARFGGPGRGRRQGAVRVRRHRQGRDAGRRQRQGAAARAPQRQRAHRLPSWPPSSARG